MPKQFLETALWKPVTMSLLEWQRSVRRLRPCEVTVDPAVEEGDSPLGQVLWAANFDGQAVGLCWPWREVQPHVLTLADPLGVTSNVLLFDESGTPLTSSRRLLRLNAAVSRLAWQADALKQRPLHALAA